MNLEYTVKDLILRPQMCGSSEKRKTSSQRSWYKICESDAGQRNLSSNDVNACKMLLQLFVFG